MHHAIGRPRRPSDRPPILGGIDPTEYQRRLFSSECLRCQAHCGRHGRDEVEPVEQREKRQPDQGKPAVRQPYQRQAPEPVVSDEQPTIVEPIR